MKAFIIGRPYHLFNAISYTVSMDVSADAFILNEYPNAKNDYDHATEAGIFRRVFFVEGTSKRPKNRMGELFYIFQRALLPWRFVCDAIDEPFLSRTEAMLYDEVYFATPGSFVLALLSVCKAKCIVIEDGTGTYSGSDFLGHQTFWHKLYCYIFRNGAMNIKVDHVLVYSKDLCKTELSQNIVQMPTIQINNDRLMQAFDKVFSFQNDNYEKRFIVLSQRLLGLNCQEIDLAQWISNVMEEVGVSDYCYRLHPAETNTVSLKNGTVCYPKEMWELLCIRYIHDNNVLITINSTAAFSPFKLYNEEPFIVFIYKVIGLQGYDCKQSDALVESLKSRYSDPSKLIVPNSRQELCAALKQIKE